MLTKLLLQADTTQHFDNISQATGAIWDKVLNWGEAVLLLLPNFILALLVVIVFYIIARLVRQGLRRLLGSFSDHSAIISLLTSIAYIMVLMVGVFVALQLLRLDKAVTSLLAGAGIIGLALSFAFQDTAANFISGVILAMRQPIRVGHLVEIKDYFGKIETINLRATIVKTLDGQHVIIPNKEVLGNSIVNYSLFPQRRVDLSVGISYGDDLKKVRDITLEAIKTLDFIRHDRPIDLYYNEFGDSSINFKIRYWVDFYNQPDYLKAMSEGIIAIKQAFDDNDIMIPFPIRTLDFGIKGGEKLNEMFKDAPLPLQVHQGGSLTSGNPQGSGDRR